MEITSPFSDNVVFVYGQVSAVDIAQVTETLGNAERSYLERVTSEKRRTDFIAGRYFARKALAELKYTVSDLDREDNGAPVWPKGIVGSISHNNGIVICAVASSSEYLALGVDVQQVSAANNYQSLLERVCCESEKSLVENCDNPQLRLIQLFSAKEALFKAADALVKQAPIKQPLSFKNVQLTTNNGHTFQISKIDGPPTALDINPARVNITSLVFGEHAVSGVTL